MISSCATQKSTENSTLETEKKMTNDNTNYDISNSKNESEHPNGTWVLETIGGDSIQSFSATQKVISLENSGKPTSVKTYPYADRVQNAPKITIDIKTMKLYGKDGCNNIRSNITTLNESELEFGPIASTRMRCGEMKIPHRFTEALEKQVKMYKIQDEKLFLFDKNGKELMILNNIEKSEGNTNTKPTITKLTDDDLPDTFKYFLTDFEKVVVKHHSEKVLQLMDQDYVKQQHDNIYRGNTKRFLNEFFCGPMINKKKFTCLEFHKIDRLKRVDFAKDNTYYYLFYEVTSRKKTIKCKWKVTVKQINKIVTYGLFGANG